MNIHSLVLINIWKTRLFKCVCLGARSWSYRSSLYSSNHKLFEVFVKCMKWTHSCIYNCITETLLNKKSGTGVCGSPLASKLFTLLGK